MNLQEATAAEVGGPPALARRAVSTPGSQVAGATGPRPSAPPS
ncbi:hypothetical protein ACWGKQ_31030 [Streptomyces sp. NPDC054770]